MYIYNFKVTRVIDGDTVQGEVDLGFKVSLEMRVRLANVDTPEIFRPKSEAEKELGLKAKQFVERSVLNKWVILKTDKDKKGKYGRYIGTIYTPEGYSQLNPISVNELLVENKLTKGDVEELE
jgi:micrococcal nuclease